MPNFKIIAVVVAVVISFGSGITVANWHHDSVELVAQKAADKVADKFSGDQQSIADGVIKSLDSWKENNVQIKESIIREKLQPIFTTQCVTDDYVRMFNEQTNGKRTGSASESAPKAGN